MLPPDFLETLKQRADIVSVINKRVKLQKKGREYQACCPFHNEKTPSFTVSPQKGFYYCFGCGAKGDALTFVKDFDNVPFMEAVKTLASETGIDVPAPSPEQQQRQIKRQSLFEVTEQVCQRYERWLRNSPALKYLQQRGLNPETIKRFRLGYALNDWEPIKQSFPQAQQQLLDTGMLIQKDNGGTYDRFRNRLMFPIMNTQNKIIGFGGRVLSKDDQPKYLNSPETSLYHKGATLYGLNTLPPRSTTAVVVEGYMDVIALQQFGIPALAPLGTALTEDQLKILWQRFNCPILCFDGDNAGMRAASRAIERIFPILKVGKSIRFVTLPTGEDPDSLIRSKGTQFFVGLLKNASPLTDFLFNLHCNPMPQSPEGRAEALKNMLDMVDSVEDNTLQSQFKQQLKNRFYEKTRNNFNNKKFGNKQPQKSSLNHNERRLKISRDKNVVGLLATLINHPWLIDEAAEEIASLQIQDHNLRQCRDTLLMTIAEHPDAKNLGPYLEQQGIDITPIRNPALLMLYRFAHPNATKDTVRQNWFEAYELFMQTSRRGISAQGLGEDND